MRLNLVVCAALFAASSFAQTSAGSISGTVVDQQNAAVANAKVTATDLAKRQIFTATTDAEGRFSMPQLLPSTYAIQVESAGFKKFEMRDQVLNANDRLALGNLTLEVGAVGETIEVAGQVAEIKTESGERSEAIVGKQLANTLINGRSYLDLTS